MSDQALEEYKKATEKQHSRNEARRILTRVNEARRSSHTAGIRWPLELLQNALDAGPRSGSDTVTIDVHHHDHTMIFQHDGAPFTSLELAALLSGGSSKEFESEDTTGRFGTGFLVTHVLAEKVHLDGLLAIGKDHERFQLDLVRGGDEDRILKNIYACNDAIRAATPAPKLVGIPSAKFEYLIDSTESLRLGLDSFRQALPYLYGTRPKLGRVTVHHPDGSIEEWIPATVRPKSVEGGFVRDRNIRIEKRDGSDPIEMCVLRFMTSPESHAAALVLLRKEPSGWHVEIPEQDRPRIYREYPLRGSVFLPINFVLDGKFDPDQERSRLLMSSHDRQLVDESLSAAILGVRSLIGEGRKDAHLLAHASVPASGFDPSNAEEKQWWTDRLASFATRLAQSPIVDTTDGLLRASPGEHSSADFVFPRLAETSPSGETTVPRLWPLVAETYENLIPPRQELASDWTRIAQGWAALGVELNLITLRKLADEVRPKEPVLDQLKVVGDKREWLARFIDVVGEAWARGVPDESIFAGLLPDQSGLLQSPQNLRRDDGVNRELKNISGDMGLNVRESLLDSELLAYGQRLRLQYLVPTLSKAVPGKATEPDIVEECLKYLNDCLPENSEYEPADEVYLKGSIRFLAYLFRSQGTAAKTVAKKVPLVVLNRNIVRWSTDRMLMAPVSSWHQAARPFRNAYPPARVLVEAYAEKADGTGPTVTAALAAWGIVYQDPIVLNTPMELKDRRLAAIAVDKTQAAGTVVSDHQFSQIALLHPELISRCGHGEEEARALLGLILRHAAPNDLSWKEIRTVKGKKAGKEQPLEVGGALWLADITFQSWVPVQDGEGNLNRMTANATTLQRLLDPAWLEHNNAAIELLSKWFGFDELDLRLLGTAPNDDQRKKLRKGLARLVESAGSDPSIYEALAQEMAARRRRERDVARFRKLGLAVQEAIKKALEARNLTLTLIDRGYDFEVAQNEAVLTGAGFRIGIGQYLLEVKATTTGQAHMTPTQAATARREAPRYVLCVVDLRGVSDDRLDGEWAATDVEPLAKLITDIGKHVTETCQHIDRARESAVGIRNEEALRYAVPVAVWQRGVSIHDWVEQLSMKRPRRRPLSHPEQG